MRTLRLIIAVVLATSLIALPMSAAMAMTRATDAEMSMTGSSDDTCPCCDAAHRCSTDVCMLKCCNASAILVTGLALVQPRLETPATIGSTGPAEFSRPPDPPPPRS